MSNAHLLSSCHGSSMASIPLPSTLVMAGLNGCEKSGKASHIGQRNGMDCRVNSGLDPGTCNDNSEEGAGTNVIALPSMGEVNPQAALLPGGTA